MADVYFQLKPWWCGPSSGYHQGAATGQAPVASLRVVIRKTAVKAFLTLAISRDGSSASVHDNLIGGLGAGMPPEFFNTGAPLPLALSVALNTPVLDQLDQLFNPKQHYYFDASHGIGLRAFLTNEFVANQFLLGPLQKGKLTLKSWLHTVTPTVTLQPENKPTKVGKRLSTLKRLDLSAGIRILDLEPMVKRSVRYLGSTNVKPNEVLPVRFWRPGLQLSPIDFTTGDLALFTKAFYKLFGGTPVVYPVSGAIEDYINDGTEFGDSVYWSDATVGTPTGIGISGVFFVVGIDLNYDDGVVNYLLLQNTLYTPAIPVNTGNIGPALPVVGVSEIDNYSVEISVMPAGASSFDWSNDFSSLFSEIKNNNGFFRIENFDHAPSGEYENPGSIVANAQFDTGPSPVVDGLKTIFRLTIDPSYFRGSVTCAMDLFRPGETMLQLPERQPAAINLSGLLVEADAAAMPLAGNFLSYQPAAPMLGASFTFGV